MCALVSFFAKWYRAKRLEVAMRQYFLVFGLLAGVPMAITSDDASVGGGMLKHGDERSVEPRGFAGNASME